jgi:hypothetical protein
VGERSYDFRVAEVSFSLDGDPVWGSLADLGIDKGHRGRQEQGRWNQQNKHHNNQYNGSQNHHIAFRPFQRHFVDEIKIINSNYISAG